MRSIIMFVLILGLLALGTPMVPLAPGGAVADSLPACGSGYWFAQRLGDGPPVWDWTVPPETLFVTQGSQVTIPVLFEMHAGKCDHETAGWVDGRVGVIYGSELTYVSAYKVDAPGMTFATYPCEYQANCRLLRLNRSDGDPERGDLTRHVASLVLRASGQENSTTHLTYYDNDAVIMQTGVDGNLEYQGQNFRDRLDPTPSCPGHFLHCGGACIDTNALGCHLGLKTIYVKITPRSGGGGGGELEKPALPSSWEQVKALYR